MLCLISPNAPAQGANWRIMLFDWRTGRIWCYLGQQEQQRTGTATAAVGQQGGTARVATATAATDESVEYRATTGQVIARQSRPSMPKNSVAFVCAGRQACLEIFQVFFMYYLNRMLSEVLTAMLVIQLWCEEAGRLELRDQGPNSQKLMINLSET